MVNKLAIPSPKIIFFNSCYTFLDPLIKDNNITATPPVQQYRYKGRERESKRKGVIKKEKIKIRNDYCVVVEIKIKIDGINFSFVCYQQQQKQ